MTAVTMHHFSGLSAPFVRSKGTVSGGVFKVVVPAGKDNHLAIAEIVDVEYFPPESVPFPLEKTKMILRRCTEEDYDEIG